MTAFSRVHPKLNRLLMMLIKSNEFLKMFNKAHFEVEALQTTCLSQYTELKINRGIYKLVSRKKIPTGYKLIYIGKRTKQTYQEVLGEWLTKYG